MKRKIKLVTVGGTFDRLHKGHITLLKKAFDVGNHVLIGLTSDDFVKKMQKKHEVSSYNERLRRLEEYLRKEKLTDRSEIIPLNDPYGPSLSNIKLEAIVVSKETEARAVEINEKRSAKNLPLLEVFVIEMVLAENGNSISTTKIIEGKIDHNGHFLK
jgi:pantetheine-phosphate adenylyltransferase